MNSTSSHWCYTCNGFVQICEDHALICPQCTGTYVEQIGEPDQRRPFPIYEHRDGHRSMSEEFMPHFNPIIAISRPHATSANYNIHDFELFYPLGAGLSFQRLPIPLAIYLKDHGLDALLGHLSQIEAAELGQVMPRHSTKTENNRIRSITVDSEHIDSDSSCVVCQDPFELGSEAQQMPCKHIYHEKCITPWLAWNNTCPLCRHEMPKEGEQKEGQVNGDRLAAATIWRLPGGGFAVGRFSGTSRRDIEQPVIYSEPNGTLHNDMNAIREVRNTGSRRRTGRISRFVQRFFTCFQQTSSN